MQFFSPLEREKLELFSDMNFNIVYFSFKTLNFTFVNWMHKSSYYCKQRRYIFFILQPIRFGLLEFATKEKKSNLTWGKRFKL